MPPCLLEQAIHHQNYELPFFLMLTSKPALTFEADCCLQIDLPPSPTSPVAEHSKSQTCGYSFSTTNNQLHLELQELLLKLTNVFLLAAPPLDLEASLADSNQLHSGPSCLLTHTPFPRAVLQESFLSCSHGLTTPCSLRWSPPASPSQAPVP